jgi:hypothetical protein
VTHHVRRTAGWLGAIVGVCLLLGCGSSDSGAQRAAVSFQSAVESGASSVACELLAPETRRQLERDEHASCEVALAKTKLPEAGAPVRVDRYGQHALVRFDDDAVFLAEYDDGWKVVAAGCTARDALPYDCVVKA